MSDIGHPDAAINLAKAELGIAEQEVVIERQEVRLLELDEEADRVDAMKVSHEKSIAQFTAEAAAKSTGALDRRRATIKAHEHGLEIKRANIRLLEIDAERRQVAVNVAASRTHIATLSAEVSQQQARLNGQEKANG